MSALPPKADIAGRQFDVRFVPEADIASYIRVAAELLRQRAGLDAQPAKLSELGP
jgi:hypothetical protein